MARPRSSRSSSTHAGSAPTPPADTGARSAATVDALQGRIEALGAQPGVGRCTLATDGAHPIDALWWQAATAPSPLQVLITAGVHGNERCGPDAALALLELLLAAPSRPSGADLTVVPLLNPAALRLGTRRGPDGVDLNRAFVDDNAGSPGVAAVRELLARRSFALALDLHRGGARRSGFWVLQHGAEPLMTRAMRRLSARWPVLAGDTRPYRMVAPGVGASGRQATLKNYLARHGVPHTATLEAPASLAHAQQVQGLVELILLILDEVRTAN